MERRYEFTIGGPFEWLRVDAHIAWACSRCGERQPASVPVFVEWLDRDGAEAQARCAEGLSCRRCESLEPLDLPLLQFRQADAVGLVVGLPPRTAREGDEAAIRDTLAVAQSKRELPGAGDVAAVRMKWWRSLWNRPLGPRLAGATPLVLPESEEEAERWRSATVAALGWPDIRAGVRELLACERQEDALDLLGRRPELLAIRWRQTVEGLCERVRDEQEDPAAREVVANRIALLRQVRQNGREWVERGAVAGELGALLAAATGDAAPAERLEALRSLVDAADGEGGGPLAVASRLACVQALHGDPRRRASDGELIRLARETLALARRELGDDHEMVDAATLNLAACLEEDAGPDSDAALAEAFELLEGLAPRIARRGSPRAADVATNLAALAQRGPGARPERPEEGASLLAEAKHMRTLLGARGRRDELIELVDEAASLRSKVSGSRRENAAAAIGLLRRALAREEEWQVLAAPERGLIQQNLANALAQLREQAPAEVSWEEVRSAAEAAIAAADELEAENPVGMQIHGNAGAILISLHTELTAAGQPPPPDLWPQGRDALERAFALRSDAYPAHHPATLQAALNLATAYGAVVDGEVADRDRCADLLAQVIERSRPHEAEFREAAGVNLAQLRVGSGEWEEAVGAYAVAAEAKRWLLAQARTPATRLGEIVAGADLASRHALALAMAGRPAEAVAVLEENRARLARGAGGGGGTARGKAEEGRATVHLTTSAYATLGIVELPSGALQTFTTTLRSAILKPAMRDLLEARDRDRRSRSLEAVIRLLAAGAVGPLVELLRDSGEMVERLSLVACGGLTSAPLHCVPDDRGRTLAESFDLRNLVSAAVPRPATPGPPARAVSVIDPDGTLPYARAEREALAGWAGSVLDPPPDRPLRSWLLEALTEADAAHIACHANLDPEDAMRSSFALGSGQELSVADLADLRSADLDLLVAPACQAASASPDAPDELLGIGHALIHAGTRTVIASLWDADDAATALVVARLYRELGAGDAPSGALAKAQRFVAGLGAEAMAALARKRLRNDPEARWLPYDLAIELLALTAHPRHRSSAEPVFGDPAEWASLSCLEA
ncbi:MAG TPA: CHAT domain-containing protein [Solirubrobacterales bacterium]|nr:CHAT domain-containing protein [Solirubrobacterales bacterium]